MDAYLAGTRPALRLGGLLPAASQPDQSINPLGPSVTPCLCHARPRIPGPGMPPAYWLVGSDHKRETSYRKCAIFIPFWSRETDAVSIEVGVCGHAECDQQRQKCCLHRVSENLPKPKLPASLFQITRIRKLCQFTRQEEPARSSNFWSFWMAAH